MGLFSRRREQTTTPASKEKPRPRTYHTRAGGDKWGIFQKRERDLDLLEKYRTYYEQGGVVTEAVNSYPLFALSPGGRLEGEDENLVSMVEDALGDFDFDRVLSDLIVGSIVYKYGVAEIIQRLDGGFHSLKSCDSSMFDIIRDDHGAITEIRQYYGHGNKYITLREEDLVIFEWNWIIHSAADDIRRDADVLDGISTAIKRHGFPRYHIKVGQEGESISDDVIEGIGRKFETLKPDMEMTTVRDVDITAIDSAGIPQAAVYNTFSVQRLVTALGVPEEVLGLGRGSTEATANVRLQTFYKKITQLQNALARTINLQVIDRITNRPSAVKWVFNDVSPVDDKLNAEVGLMMVQANGPIDPEYFFTRQEIRDRFGFQTKHPDEMVGGAT